jgi:hypothetical protein
MRASVDRPTTKSHANIGDRLIRTEFGRIVCPTLGHLDHNHRL